MYIYIVAPPPPRRERERERFNDLIKLYQKITNIYFIIGNDYREKTLVQREIYE